VQQPTEVETTFRAQEEASEITTTINTTSAINTISAPLTAVPAVAASIASNGTNGSAKVATTAIASKPSPIKAAAVAVKPPSLRCECP